MLETFLWICLAVLLEAAADIVTDAYGVKQRVKRWRARGQPPPPARTSKTLWILPTNPPRKDRAKPE